MTERLDILALAAGGRVLSGDPNTLISGIFTDTRALVRGGLFIALRGENFDGNRFAGDAIQKYGAAAVLLDKAEAAKNLPENAAVILVEDSRKAYLNLAFHHRSNLLSAVWFGITGSVGKSSVKEMLAHVLEQAAGWNAHKAPASFNNAVGLSQTVLGATSEHQAVVLELGTNHPGEIKALAAVARPNIAIITCAAEAHLEAFGSVVNIAREKGDLLSFQDDQDVAVLNADDPHLPLWRSLALGKIITFGQSEQADVRGKQACVNATGCVEFMVRCGDSIADCRLRVLGGHQVMNALAAIAAAIAAGVRLEDAARAVNTFEGVARRLALKETQSATLIDDAYNANPASFAAALAALKNLRAQRKFLIAGDMLELGLDAPQYHRELGRLIADCALTTVVTVGPLAALAGAAAVKDCSSPLNWISCSTPQEAAQALKPSLRPGDVVLLKASHGIHLEKCMEILSA
ncbi:MAG: UDP-N-acetylmuramoyl-tripeptide--D-alanyl-D-alanine ligase [Planctomycetota bacterium]